MPDGDAVVSSSNGRLVYGHIIALLNVNPVCVRAVSRGRDLDTTAPEALAAYQRHVEELAVLGCYASHDCVRHGYELN